MAFDTMLTLTPEQIGALTVNQPTHAASVTAEEDNFAPVLAALDQYMGKGTQLLRSILDARTPKNGDAMQTALTAHLEKRVNSGQVSAKSAVVYASQLRRFCAATIEQLASAAIAGEFGWHSSYRALVAMTGKKKLGAPVGTREKSADDSKDKAQADGKAIAALNLPELILAFQGLRANKVIASRMNIANLVNETLTLLSEEQKRENAKKN